MDPWGPPPGTRLKLGKRPGKGLQPPRTRFVNPRETPDRCNQRNPFQLYLDQIRARSGPSLVRIVIQELWFQALLRFAPARQAGQRQVSKAPDAPPGHPVPCSSRAWVGCLAMTSTNSGLFRAPGPEPVPALRIPVHQHQGRG